MTLEKLRNIINSVSNRIEAKGEIKVAGTENGIGDIPVMIALNEPSIGSRRMTQVSFAALGFDWEAGMFVLSTEEPLVRESFGKKAAERITRRYGSNVVYSCSCCGTVVGKTDRYCKHCGKKLTEPENIH